MLNKNKLKTLCALVAMGTSAIVGGVGSHKVCEWKENSDRVLAVYNNWKDYAKEKAVPQDKIREDRKTDFIKMRDEYLENAKAGKVNIPERSYLVPEEFNANYITLMQKIKDISYHGASSLREYHESLVFSDPLKEEESIFDKAKKDSERMARDFTARRTLMQKMGDYDERSSPAIMVAALTGRVSEAMRKGFIKDYEMEVIGGMYFDMKGYDREAETHFWIEAEGKIMDVATKSNGNKEKSILGREDYIKLIGDRINFKLGAVFNPNSANGLGQGLSFKVTPQIYVNPNN